MKKIEAFLGISHLLFALILVVPNRAYAENAPSTINSDEAGRVSALWTGPPIGVIATIPEAREPKGTNAAVMGRFQVGRDGNEQELAQTITVHLEYWGTADSIDYEPLPTEITLPGGVRSVSFDVIPVADGLDEGMETIEARIVPPMPINISGGLPYEGVFGGDRIQILPDVKVVPNPPMVRIQTVPGETAGPGNSLISGVFNVSRTQTNVPLRVRLAYTGTVSPTNYQAGPAEIFFPAGVESTNITITPLMPNVRTEERILARVLPWRANPNDPNDNRFIIDWNRASAEVKLKPNPAVAPIIDPPVISIIAIAAETTEPGSNITVDPGKVKISSAKPWAAHEPIEVVLDIGGSATESVDYSPLPHVLRFGSVDWVTATLSIDALADDVVEPDEVIEIRLADPAANAGYLVDPAHRAVAVVIHDSSSVSLVIPSPEATQITEVRGMNGVLHFRFKGAPGMMYSLEQTSDLRVWHENRMITCQSSEMELSVANDPMMERQYYRLRHK